MHEHPTPGAARIGRRRLLQLGGLAAAGAGLTACINGPSTASQATTTTSTTIGTKHDFTTLRTASSIEALLMQAYQRVLAANLVTTPAVLASLQLFQTEHSNHSDFFVAQTERAGGVAYTDANPALAQALSPQLAGLKSEHDAVQLLYMLEQQAAATYQAAVSQLDNILLGQAFMSVGGIEVRHMTVLAPSIGQPTVMGPFASATGAVPSGTGGVQQT